MAKFAPADDQFAKLTSADRNGFAVGDLSQNLIFGTVGGFLLFYLTSISGISAAVGANGLLFTPYLVGERTPYADGDIRGSFIGIDGTHQRFDFVRAVLEGIIYSFKDIFDIYDAAGAEFDTVVAIGGGAKSPLWLQIQADIFNKKVVALKNEQGPGMGAAILTDVGLGWFKTVQEAAEAFTEFGDAYLPDSARVAQYEQMHTIYKQVYRQTAELSHELMDYRRSL